jgi:hypothetical protein
MTIIKRIRDLTMVGAVALIVAAMGTLAQPAAAATDTITTPVYQPVVGSWFTTIQGAASSVAIVTFSGPGNSGRVTISPVSGVIPQSTGEWTYVNSGEYVMTTYAIRSGPTGALELERTRSSIRLDSRSNSWVVSDSYSQFLDPTTQRVIAAQPGLVMQGVALSTTSSTPR